MPKHEASPRSTSAELMMSVSRFKAECHALVNRIEKGRVRRIVLTKRGKPVAALVSHAASLRPLRGAMKGTVFIPPGVDITEPTGEVWDAERDN